MYEEKANWWPRVTKAIDESTACIVKVVRLHYWYHMITCRRPLYDLWTLELHYKIGQKKKKHGGHLFTLAVESIERTAMCTWENTTLNEQSIAITMPSKLQQCVLSAVDNTTRMHLQQQTCSASGFFPSTLRTLHRQRCTFRRWHHTRQVQREEDKLVLTAAGSR